MLQSKVSSPLKLSGMWSAVPNGALRLEFSLLPNAANAPEGRFNYPRFL